MSDWIQSLADAVHGVASPFVCGGEHRAARPVTIRFRNGFEVTPLPKERTQEAENAELVERCLPAKFGHGRRTRVDRSVRDAVQLDARDGAFEIPEFDPREAGIVEQVRRELAPAVPSLDCELHSLNVYGREGHFRPHKDTPRGERMLGTLVVCLPSHFKQGQLLVMHRGAHRVFDWGTEIAKNPDPRMLRWAAFFGDVDHAIERLWWGSRVTLTYVLSAGAGHGALLEEPAAKGRGVAGVLSDAMKERDFMSDGGTLAFPCFHMYGAEPDAANVPRRLTPEVLPLLKGRDLEVARAALDNRLDVSLRSFLIETCADEVWELKRFPTPRERDKLGKRLDPQKLERALPLAGPGRAGPDRDVTWVVPAPRFNGGPTFYDPSANPRSPAVRAEVPALEYLHECEYSGTGYFGNEGADLFLYLYSALYVTVPPVHERSARERRSNVIELDSKRPRPVEVAVAAAAPVPPPKTPTPRRLIVDIRHWLDENGNIPRAPARLRSQALRVARIIEYGGPIAPGHAVGTLIECTRKPGKTPCPGMLWVEKLEADTLVGFCLLCKGEEIFVHHWQDTPWANGPMEPVSADHDETRVP